MSGENHLKFSLIIPCYNESDNIENLFEKISEIQNEVNFEVIIINNGSTDDSSSVIDKNKHRLKNLILINILVNKGIGYAIKEGINKSNSDIVCYTHADLQVDLKSCIEAYKKFSNSNEDKIFVKSIRKKRPIIHTLFSLLMFIFNTALFRKILYDIHSQPNLFRKLDKDIVDKAPNNMSIDLYFYLYFKINKFKIIRFNVEFLERKHGMGSNDTILQKLRYIPLAITNSIKLFFYDK